jgi:hypothetical protein
MMLTGRNIVRSGLNSVLPGSVVIDKMAVHDGILLWRPGKERRRESCTNLKGVLVKEEKKLLIHDRLNLSGKGAVVVLKGWALTGRTVDLYILNAQIVVTGGEDERGVFLEREVEHGLLSGRELLWRGFGRRPK